MNVKNRTPLHVYYVLLLYSNYACKRHIITYAIHYCIYNYYMSMYGFKFKFIIVLWLFVAHCQSSRFDRFERWRVCTRWWVNKYDVRERFTKYLDIRLITFFFSPWRPFSLTLRITKLRHSRGCYRGFTEANVNYNWASVKCIWYFYENRKKKWTNWLRSTE